MSEQVLKCPQCGAPLRPPSRFARDTVCPFCKATVRIDLTTVSAERFHAAHREWIGHQSAGGDCRIGDAWFQLGRLVGTGEASQVYLAERVRSPRERVLLKILRSAEDRPLLDAEWQALQRLQASEAPGASAFTRLLPQPVLRGQVSEGAHRGAEVLGLRFLGGFRHTVAEARRAYGAGVDPRVGVWLWRRLLEVLSFVHQSGLVHGAVLPQHVLFEDGDHGARLVGFGCAGRAKESLRAVCTAEEAFYPAWFLASATLAPGADLCMSARLVAFLLGGEPSGAGLPSAVPPPLASLLGQVASRAEGAPADAWALREALGPLARQLFGPPSFHPLVMPD